jgi:carboxyl-terminal processing protease
VGEPTFGKNTVQVWGRLENEGGVRITISRWFTPDHNSVAPDGIQPDIDAARAADTPPEDDPALDAALEFLAEQPVAAPDGEGALPDGAAAVQRSGVGSVVGIVAPRPIC